jgi:hypothetical protein
MAHQEPQIDSVVSSNPNSPVIDRRKNVERFHQIENIENGDSEENLVGINRIRPLGHF